MLSSKHHQMCLFAVFRKQILIPPLKVAQKKDEQSNSNVKLNVFLIQQVARIRSECNIIRNPSLLQARMYFFCGFI